MSVLPWRSFCLESDRSFEELIRWMSDSIPPCTLAGAARRDAYFCGMVDVTTGTFMLYRNTGRTIYRSGRFLNRHVAPVLHGTLKPDGPGTTLDVSIVPGAGFWFGVLLLMVAALPIPLGLLLWLLQAAQNPLWFCFFGVLTVSTKGWLWVPILLAHYLRVPRYRDELMRIMARGSRPEDHSARPTTGRNQLSGGENDADSSPKKAWKIPPKGWLGLAAFGVFLIGYGYLDDYAFARQPASRSAMHSLLKSN